MAGKPIYRGNKLNVMGAPRRMGQLTDEHIRDFYDLQARDGFAKEAVEELVRTEHKTREEIEDICGIRKDEEMIDPETKAAILEDARNGMSSGQLAIKYRMNAKAISYHLTVARKNGQLPPAKNSAGTHKKDGSPDNSKGRNEKNKNPPPTQTQVNVFPQASVPEKGTACSKNSVWYELLEQLEAFALAAFGDGTVFDSCATSTEKKIARLGVLTPEGKKVQITIEEYNND